MRLQIKLFCDEYRKDRTNGAAAAVRAGYSTKSAKVRACHLLKRDDVREYLGEKSRQLEQQFDLDINVIVAEMWKIGRANIADFLGSNGLPITDFSELTRDQLAAVSEVTVEEYMIGRGDDAQRARRLKFKFHNKQDALRSLYDHFAPAAQGGTGGRDGSGPGAGGGKREIVLINDPDAPGQYSLPEATRGAAGSVESDAFNGIDSSGETVR